MSAPTQPFIGGGYGPLTPQPEAPTTAQIEPSALGDLFQNEDFLNSDYSTQHQQLTRVGQAAFNYIQAHPQDNDEHTADIFAEKMSHAYDLIKPPEPHGFLGSIAAPFNEDILPAVATAAGGIGAGTAALPGGPVAVAAADILGGAAAGTLARKGQDAFRGPIATMRARKQLEVDREAHPIGYAIGATPPGIISLTGGGAPKAVTRMAKVGKAAIGGARAGASMASQGVFGGIKGSSWTDIPKAMAEGAVTMGPLGLIGPAKTFLKAIGIKAPAEALVYQASKALYETSAEALSGKPVDLQKHFQEFTGGVTGGIPAFIILNALSSLVHGRSKGATQKPSEPAPEQTQQTQTEQVETNPPATPDETRPSPEAQTVQPAEALPSDQGGPESVQPEAPPSGSNPPVTPPVPPVDVPPEEAMTSLKFAVVDQERLARGLEAMPPSDGQGIKNAFAQAAAEKAGNDNVDKETLASLKASPRPIEPHESALMLGYKSRLRGTEKALQEKLADPGTPDTERAAAQEVLDYVQSELQDIYDVMGRKGPATMASLVLLMQKEWAKEDNSYEAIKVQMKAANNGNPISPEQDAKAKDIAEKFKKNQKKAEDLEAKTAEQERTAGVQKIYDGLKKAQKTAKAKPKSSFQDFIDKQIQDAKDRLSGKSGRLFASVDPLGIADHVIIGAGYLAKGVIKAAEWTAAMVKEFGEGIRPHLAEIHAKAQELHLQWKRDFAANAKATTPEGIMADVQPSDGAPDSKVAIKLFQSHIAAGVEGAEKVAQAVHNDILTKFPKATLQQTRDAISGYGKVKLPSQQANKIKERDYRRQLQLISSLERAKQKLAPLKSGPQRDKASAEVRDLEKQLKDAMVEFQIETKSPAKQLADARTAITSRLTNQIEDLNRIISGTSKTRPNRKPIEYDAQMKALEKERDELKSYVDDLKGTRDRTQEEKIKSATDAVNKSIVDLEQRIRDGELGKRSPQQIDSPALSTLRQKRDALREQLNDMREAAGLGGMTPEQFNKIATRAAQASEKYYRNRIAAKDYMARKKPSFEATQATKDARTQRDEARKEYQDLREASGVAAAARLESATKAAENRLEALRNELITGHKPTAGKPPVVTPELQAMRDEASRLSKAIRDITGARNAAKKEAAAKSIQKSIDELDRRIKQSDFSKPAKNPPFTTPELDALRQARDTKRNQYRQMLAQERAMLREIKAAAEEAKNPSPTPEQIALKNLKSRLNKSIATLQNQIKTGIFDKPTRQQIADDAESMKLKAEKELLMDEKRSTLNRIALENEPAWRKLSRQASRVKRAFVLLTAPIYFKLAAAGNIIRPFTTLLEETIGRGFGKLLMPETMRNAEGTGGASGLGAVPDYLRGMGRGFKEMGNVFRTGKTTNQAAYGSRPKTADVPHIEDYLIGHSHMAIKAPAWEAAFGLSEGNRLAKAGKTAAQMTPEELTALRREAAKDADHAIYTNENKASKAYNQMLGVADRSGWAGQIVADIARVENVIVKIPTNLIHEASKYILGSMTAPIRSAVLRARQAGVLTPEQYNDIARTFKKGTTFATLVAISAAGGLGVKSGGLYRAGERRKPGDMEPEEIEIFGQKLPHNLTHAGIFTAIHAIGTAIRSFQKGQEENASMPMNSLSSVVAGAFGLLGGVPFVKGTHELLTGIVGAPDDAQKAWERFFKGFVPGPLRAMAESQDYHGDQGFMDRTIFGMDRKDITPRKVKTIGESIQSAIPRIPGMGFFPSRQDLPIYSPRR